MGRKIYLLGIVGSMRKNGNTSLLVETVLKSTRDIYPDTGTEIVYMSELNIEPCHVCFDECCREPYKCIIEDDLEEVFEKMKKADGIVIGSPLYFKIPSRLTAFMERLVCLSYFYKRRGFKEPYPLNDKPCGLIAVSGSDNPYPVLETLLDFVLRLRMKPIIMKNYPYIGVAGIGDVRKDEKLKPLENARIMGNLLVNEILKTFKNNG